MGDLDCGVGFVPVLTASTRPSAGHYIEVSLIDLGGFLNTIPEDSHGYSGGMAPAVPLVGWDTLKSVPPWFGGENLLGILAFGYESDEPRVSFKEGTLKDSYGLPSWRRPDTARSQGTGHLCPLRRLAFPLSRVLSWYPPDKIIPRGASLFLPPAQSPYRASSGPGPP